MVEIERARNLLELLGLSQSAITIDAHLDRAAREESTYLSFLNRILEDESDARKKRSEETRL